MARGMCEAHRLLVEWREAHRIRLAVRGHAQRVAVVGKCGGPALLARHATLHCRGIQMLQILKINIPNFNSRSLRPLVEYAAVADHHHLRSVAHLFERDGLGGELGADAAGVSHGECDYGPSARRGIHVVISGT